MAQSPILGGFSKARAGRLADNEAINLFTEIIETKDGKVPGALFGTAGLDLIGTLGSGPIRGVQRLGDLLHVVSGAEVYSLTPNGIATLLGQLVNGTALVSMFNNGFQMMIVDGVGGWLAPGGFPLTGGVISGLASGSLYALNDTITLKAATGSQSTYPILTVSAVANNPVTNYLLPNAGTAYSTATGVGTSVVNGQPGAGSGLTLDIGASGGPIVNVLVSSGGTNYAVGDTGTIAVFSSNAIYQVTAVSAGVVTAVMVLTPGTTYGNDANVATTRGSGLPANIGTGFSLDITAAGGPITASSVAAGGQNYVTGAVGLIAGGSGDATYLVTAVGAHGVVTGFTITQAGTVNDRPASFTQQSTSGSGANFVLIAPAFGAWLGLVPVNLPFANPMVGGISDGFGVLVFLGSQNIAASAQRDLSTWDPLSYAVSDSSPDNCLSLEVIHDEVYILKENHTEIWIDAGLSPFPFQLLTSARMESGIMAPYSPAKAGEVMFFLSRNEQGQGIVVMLSGGYQLAPVSTQALINEFDTYPNLGDAIGYARQQGGHVFYVLTFPEADKTWAYDMTASQMAGVALWHRLAAWTDGAWHRHYGNCFTPWKGAVNLVNEITTYQARSVTLTSAVLTRAAAPVGLAPLIVTAVFSVWAYLPDSAGSGIYCSNHASAGQSGLAIGINNDALGSPQIAIGAWDAAGNPIVEAIYGFSTWSAWVNILISLDTATQRLQVYASTIVSEVLIETHLTPAAITWSSANPIATPPSQPWRLTAVS